MPASMPIGNHDIIWPTDMPLDMPVGVNHVAEVSPTGESTRQLAKLLRQLAWLLFTTFQYQVLTKVSNVPQEIEHFCNQKMVPFLMKHCSFEYFKALE